MIYSFIFLFKNKRLKTMSILRVYNLRSGPKMILNKSKIIYFDLETTGLNYFHDHIIEIAAMDNLGNVFNELVDPGIKVPSKITKITNITNSMVKGKPKIDTILKDFVKFCYKDIQPKDDVYLVAHNCIAFDKLFLERQFLICGITLPPWKYIDSLFLSKYILPDRYSHRLQALCNYWNIVQKDAHRALSDVEDLEKVFNLLMHLWERKHGQTPIKSVYEFLLSKNNIKTI